MAIEADTSLLTWTEEGIAQTSLRTKGSCQHRETKDKCASPHQEEVLLAWYL
jgi:hypothetical protein